MHKRVFVRLSPEALGALLRRAARERRSPGDEAALIIERSLSVEAAEGTERASPGSRVAWQPPVVEAQRCET